MEIDLFFWKISMFTYQSNVSLGILATKSEIWIVIFKFGSTNQLENFVLKYISLLNNFKFAGHNVCIVTSTNPSNKLFHDLQQNEVWDDKYCEYIK